MASPECFSWHWKIVLCGFFQYDVDFFRISVDKIQEAVELSRKVWSPTVINVKKFSTYSKK